MLVSPKLDRLKLWFHFKYGLRIFAAEQLKYVVRIKERKTKISSTIQIIDQENVYVQMTLFCDM